MFKIIFIIIIICMYIAQMVYAAKTINGMCMNGMQFSFLYLHDILLVCWYILCSKIYEHIS